MEIDTARLKALAEAAIAAPARTAGQLPMEFMDFYDVAGPAVVLELLAALSAANERAKRAEGIAHSVLESVTAGPNTVIVLHGAEAQHATGICADLARIMPPKSLVVVLPDGMTLEQVREKEMREYGWVREDAMLLPLNLPASLDLADSEGGHHD